MDEWIGWREREKQRMNESQVDQSYTNDYDAFPMVSAISPFLLNPSSHVCSVSFFVNSDEKFSPFPVSTKVSWEQGRICWKTRDQESSHIRTSASSPIHLYSHYPERPTHFLPSMQNKYTKHWCMGNQQHFPLLHPNRTLKFLGIHPSKQLCASEELPYPQLWGQAWLIKGQVTNR